MEFVALRREDLTPEQMRYQRALDRSWAVVQQRLADAECVADFEASMRRIDSGEASPPLTRDEFLAQTQRLHE